MSKQPADKRMVDALLSQLESHCRAGDIGPMTELLNLHIGPYLLTRFRERKMLLLAPKKARQGISLVLLNAAKVLDPSQQDLLLHYLRFIIAVDSEQSQVLNALRVQLLTLPRCCIADLIDISSELFEWGGSRIEREQASSNYRPTIADPERRLHDFNGRLIDLANAIARAINEFSRTDLLEHGHRNLQRRERRRALKILRRIVFTAGRLNSLEWILDSVTFGDFTVIESTDESAPTFRLDFGDTRLQLLRRLDVRRELIMNYAGQREKRYVREKLLKIQDDILEYVLNYYCVTEQMEDLAQEDVNRVIDLARKSLILIDAEDDLLIAAGKFDQKIQAYYIAGMVLGFFAVTGLVVKTAKFSLDRKRIPAAIPLSIIFTMFSNEALMKEAVEILTHNLPVRSHNLLMKAPYVRDGSEMAWPILGGDFGTWNVAVREALIQEGALGKDVGSTWENFYERSFDETGWQVIGKGVKLKRHGKILTDIDLMLVRDDLLLVVQIKALAGSGDTPYDHWKNRQIIEAGCRQARISADYLSEDRSKLVSICGRRCAESIHIIQPVVLTNIGHLQGWSHLDVPVISESTRKAICRGSKVDYFNASTGKLVHTKVFVGPDELSTKEILRLIREPIELKIAAEKPEVIYRFDQLGSVAFYLPEFAMNPDAFEPQIEADIEND